jgi:mRNA-degrading endonuclease RelE of RelBE toxin-antitoxin system
LGPKLADKQQAAYSKEAANAANATFNTYQYGYTGGANQVSTYRMREGIYN